MQSPRELWQSLTAEERDAAAQRVAKIRARRKILCEFCLLDCGAEACHIQFVQSGRVICVECFRHGVSDDARNDDIFDTASGAFRSVEVSRPEYHVVSHNTEETLFDENWTYADEVTLLDTMRRKGFGNFHACADVIGKRHDECRVHYERVFLAAWRHILDLAATKALRQEEAGGEVCDDVLRLADTVDFPYAIPAHEHMQGGQVRRKLHPIPEELRRAYPGHSDPAPLPQSARFRAHPLQHVPTRTVRSAQSAQSESAQSDSVHSAQDGEAGAAVTVAGTDRSDDRSGDQPCDQLIDQSSHRQPPPVVPRSAAAALGVNYKRLDFDIEFENEFESLLSNVEFHEDDTETEKEVKCALLQAYAELLQVRKQRKLFALESGILYGRTERLRNKADKDVERSMRPLMRMLPPDLHRDALHTAVVEGRLRRRIRLLQLHRQMGVRRMDESNDLAKRTGVRKQAPVRPSLLPNTRSGLATEPVRRNSRQRKRRKPFETSEMQLYRSLTQHERVVCKKLILRPSEFLRIKHAVVTTMFRHGKVTPELLREKIDFKIDIAARERVLPERLVDFFVARGHLTPESAKYFRPPPAKQLPVKRSRVRSKKSSNK